MYQATLNCTVSAELRGFVCMDTCRATLEVTRAAAGEERPVNSFNSTNAYFLCGQGHNAWSNVRMQGGDKQTPCCPEKEWVYTLKYRLYGF